MTDAVLCERTPASGLKLTPSQARVLDLLRLCAGDDGVAVVSKGRMAILLDLNEKTVERALARLRREGVVESVPRHGEDGAQLANGYRVAPE